MACSLACTFSSTCSIESHPPNSRGVTILSLGCSCTFSCGETVVCFAVFFTVGVADGVGVTTCSLGVFSSGKTHGIHGRFFHFLVDGTFNVTFGHSGIPTTCHVQFKAL